MSHTKLPGDDTCSCENIDRIPFLDTALKIVDGRISSTLYRKPSDRNKYLLPSSCHPPHCTKNILFSLATRVIRICSEADERDKQLAILREMILLRDYHPSVINAAITRALESPRESSRSFSSTAVIKCIFLYIFLKLSCHHTSHKK